MFAIVWIVNAILHVLIRQPEARGVFIGVHTRKTSESLLVVPRIMRALTAAAPLRRLQLSQSVWLASVHSAKDLQREAAACNVQAATLGEVDDSTVLVTANEGEITAPALYDVAFVEIGDEAAARRAAEIARVVVVVSRNHEKLNEFIDDIYQSPLNIWLNKDDPSLRRKIIDWRGHFREEEPIPGILKAVLLWEEEAELVGETQPKIPHNELVQHHANGLASSGDLTSFLEALEPHQVFPMDHLLYYARYDQLEPDAAATLAKAHR